MSPLNSWGNYPKVKPSRVIDLYWRDQVIAFANLKDKVLAYGQGRSYGDSCLNENGIILSTKNLNRFIHFDAETGVLECEAGVTLSDILEWSVPRGWFLPVLPGTKLVSIGGAIANDIHGKNHHSNGTFGHHVLSIELLRSNGEIYHCSREENSDALQATIGGLGLTGLILSAKIQLRAVSSTLLETQYIPFQNLDGFLKLNAESENNYEYTVAWLDCVADGKNFGRGIYMRANHADRKTLQVSKKTKLNIPFNFPKFVLNHYSIKTFNQFYFNHQRKKIGSHLVFYESFFFPLDSIQNWNRIYGKKGFLQYQCVLPMDHANEIKSVLQAIVGFGLGSFLSVLKTFGDVDPAGMLSFPMRGVTLALDIPYRGKSSLALLNHLDAIVMSYGGKVYPAKDARMSPEAFKIYYPQWETFSSWIDPQFSSSFWRRVTNHEK